MKHIGFSIHFNICALTNPAHILVELHQVVSPLARPSFLISLRYMHWGSGDETNCLLHIASLIQEVVTPKWAPTATRDCDPVYGRCRCGLLYFPIFYRKVMKIRRLFATVIGSPAV